MKIFGGARVLKLVGIGVALVIVGANGSIAKTAPFALPFREDRAAYFRPTEDNPNGTFRGRTRDDSGCTAPDANGHRDCLPAGATMVMLADGGILYWNAIEGQEDVEMGDVPELGAAARNDQSRVLRLRASPSKWLKPSPVDGGARNTDPEPELLPGMKDDNDEVSNNGSLFCSDQKFLADGRVIAIGGTDYYNEPAINDQYGVLELEGVKGTRVFDPKTLRWHQTAPMHYGRWYPTAVTLGNGRIFVASGVTKLIKPVYPSHPADSGRNVTQTETYIPGANRWIDNTAGGANPAAARSLPLYARLHLLPNGNVYYDAAGQVNNPAGYAYDESTWRVAAVYDVAARAWRDLGIPDELNVFGGFRGSTFSAVLPLRAPYTKASFVTGGGVLLATPGSYLPVADTRINTVSGPRGREVLTSVTAGPMGRPRWFSTGVPLPDGTILALSGADVDEVLTPGREAPIREAEIFTPTYDAKGNVTGGSWRDAGRAFRSRTYHNNAVLLPDGRVLVGGHAPIARDAGQQDGAIVTPVREFANNHHDSSFEIYSPAYLSRGPRPVIGTVNRDVVRGRELVIPLRTPARNVANVVLMRNMAQTHVVDADGRTVELTITKRTAWAIHVAIPRSANVLPAGPYLLFVNAKSKGGKVPSVARQVFVRP